MNRILGNMLNEKSIALFLKVIYNTINEEFANRSLNEKEGILWLLQNKEILYYCYYLSGGR